MSFKYYHTLIALCLVFEASFLCSIAQGCSQRFRPTTIKEYTYRWFIPSEPLIFQLKGELTLPLGESHGQAQLFFTQKHNFPVRMWSIKNFPLARTFFYIYDRNSLIQIQNTHPTTFTEPVMTIYYRGIPKYQYTLKNLMPFSKPYSTMMLKNIFPIAVKNTYVHSGCGDRIPQYYTWLGDFMVFKNDYMYMTISSWPHIYRQQQSKYLYKFPNSTAFC